MSKKLKRLIIPMIAVMMLLVSASVVQAAGARQTKAGQKSVKIAWDKPDLTGKKLHYYTRG